MTRRRDGFTVRSAEDKCGVPTDTGEHWDADEAGEVEIAYAMALPSEKARVLRRYISSAEYEAARSENASFAQALAADAGFSDREIRRLVHLRDGAVPANGWTGDAFWLSLPKGGVRK